MDTQTIQMNYEAIREYFTRPDAVLAKGMRGESPACFYRTPDGNACAVGCRIPDELYDPSFEDTGTIEALTGALRGTGTYDGVGMEVPNVREIIGDEKADAVLEIFQPRTKNFDFLSRAQREHDRPETKTVTEFIRRLDSIAREFDLTICEEGLS